MLIDQFELSELPSIHDGEFDLMTILNCHSLGFIDFSRGEDEQWTSVRIVNGDSVHQGSIDSVLCPSSRRGACGVLYMDECSEGLYCLMTIQHKGTEEIKIQKLKGPLLDSIVMILLKDPLKI